MRIARGRFVAVALVGPPTTDGRDDGASVAFLPGYDGHVGGVVAGQRRSVRCSVMTGTCRSSR
jgi:hypothetical protein